jgi:phosphatidylinositol glycan class O
MDLVLFVIQLAGLYIFSAGYLLSRLELPTISSLTPANKQFNKTLLIMVDALRFDFMNPTEIPKGEDVPNYINKLPIINEYLNNHNENCVLFRGLADPPTTTLQRLMAIMTGALPTLVDAGSNFDSSSLKEDNFLKKLQARGEKVISIGDDTWDKLYPKGMDESYFYPSFDVWDLDTLDNGVKEHLFPILEEKKEWGLMIAHFLGVDHAGHRYVLRFSIFNHRFDFLDTAQDIG